jgi:hypothetical protein
MYSTLGQYAAVMIIWLTLFVSPGAAYGNPDLIPEPNPPWDERDAEMVAQQPTGSRALAPAVEWVLHKTADGRHPDENEQQLMWLMNRARSNPTAEGIWLSDIYDRYHIYLPDCGQLAEDIDNCYIAGAVDHWGVDLDLLQNEFAAYAAKPPAAFDVRLYRAAKSHSEYLISTDSQNHTGQFDRIVDENFFYRRVRGNVFSYSLGTIFGHAAFNVDWGPDGGNGTGMQSPPGHRLAIMSIDGNYTNVGYAVIPEFDSATDVGPLVITGNFCEANTAAENHFNRFLVGTVWSDDDGDDFYDPGEGIGGVIVMPDQGAYYAVTSDAGGYAVPIAQSGTYEVSFSGGGRALNEIVKIVSIVDESVLLDLVADVNSDLSAEDASGSSSGGGGGGGGCFITSSSEDHSANLELGRIIMVIAIILLGAAARGRGPQKR